MSTPTDRPVRVTIDGQARNLATDPNLLRVEYGSPKRVLLIDTTKAGVTLEDRAPAWEWSEGDVVAGEHIVYRRNARGVWIGNAGTPGLTYDVDDAMVSAAAGKRGGYDVLRYAKGAE
jgi:hypothetical protein